MALLFMDSFDHYATGDVTEKWTSLGAGSGDASTITAAIGRHSSSAWKATCGSSGNDYPKHLLKTLSPADNTIIVGMAFKPVTSFINLDVGTDSETFVNNSALFSVRHVGGTQVWVKVNTTGTISVYRDTTLLGTTSGVLTENVYNYVEVLLTIHNTTGVITIRFNGTQVLNLTSQNTRFGASNLWDQFRLGVPNAIANFLNPEWHFDDLYICDGSGSAPWNTFLGDVRVDALYPTAEGTTIGWTPLSGTDNALMIDETAPNDDTDYNSAAAVATDTLVVQDAPVVGATIYGIQHCISMKKMDAGSASVAPVIRHSSTDNVGSNINPSTSYSYGLAINQTNPGTGVQWTEAGFNAAEFGYKKTV